MTYETIIGLEVHAQLRTESKLFCGCSTAIDTRPNTHTCPVCLGLPGALPALNKKAVKYAVKMALAVHCQIQERSIFARKNYFYPDLPKGYQITQYDKPLAKDGWLEIALEKEGEKKRIGIQRIHLEEDAGKLIHSGPLTGKDKSLVDLNRCGIPLIEIVCDPDLQTPKEAQAFLKRIHHIVQWLGICDANMEEGNLRCDANISMKPAGSDTFGVKTEIKNLNSFRNLGQALVYEQKRQVQVLDAGKVIHQETLLWDDSREEAISMRGKEEAHDYRYFPDPDLGPLEITKDEIESINKGMPELPDERMCRWVKDYGLSEYDAFPLMQTRELADYFEEVVSKTKDVRQTSNWIKGEIFHLLRENRCNIQDLKVRPQHLARLIRMVCDGDLSSTSGKAVLHEISRTGEEPDSIVKRLGIQQLSDPVEIEQAIQTVMDQHDNVVQKYIQGKESVLGYLVGQVLRLTEGKANPQIVNTILIEKMTALQNEEKSEKSTGQ
ncbi:Asp-tRNA(Asn)/Glu-tRNA(Gln) amidotransferase subunit GatB [bacterium]